LHQSALSQARLVLKHRPDLAAAIRDGEGSLEKAYAAVMAERTAGGDGGDGVPAKAYRQPKRKYPQALEDAAAAMVLDQGKTTAEAGAAAGVSAQVVIKSVAREQGRREAEAEIDPASLSISAQQKLATAIRQKERKLELDFEQRVQAEAQRRMREISLPHHLEALADAKRIMTTHKGIMPRAQFRKILACLHPDSQPSEAEKGEAFHFFKLHERALVAAAELPPPDDFPTTVEELLARRKKPLKPQPATTTP
jgi:hypothetical protein